MTNTNLRVPSWGNCLIHQYAVRDHSSLLCRPQSGKRSFPCPNVQDLEGVIETRGPLINLIGSRDSSILGGIWWTQVVYNDSRPFILRNTTYHNRNWNSRNRNLQGCLWHIHIRDRNHQIDSCKTLFQNYSASQREYDITWGRAQSQGFEIKSTHNPFFRR